MKITLKVSLAALFLVSLSGCNPPPEEIERKRLAENSHQCEVFGFKPGTNDFSKCLLQLHQTDTEVANESLDALMESARQKARDVQYRRY